MTLERGEACKRIRKPLPDRHKIVKATKTIMQVCSISMYKSLANRRGNYST